MRYKNPALTADVIIEKNGKILLVRRNKKPFVGKLDTPGGFVNYGETVEHAAIREAKEETGLDVKLVDILGVYSDPKRDPRKHVVTVMFIGKILRGKPRVNDKTEVRYVSFYDMKKLKKEELGFDHYKIIRDYLKHKKEKGTYWSTK